MHTDWFPDTKTLESAVALACRAPSLHNSQPWRWVLDNNSLELYSDPDRLLPATDAFGRQLILSCGTALDHVIAAFAAVGWTAIVERIPNRDNPFHLATIEFKRIDRVSDAAVNRAEAIAHRRTDRSPFAEPPNWALVAEELSKSVVGSGLRLDVLGQNCRPGLTTASELVARVRSHDSMYQDELNWWTGHAGLPDGVPSTALVSADEGRHVAVGRNFPAGQSHSDQHPIEDDHAEFLLLSTPYDTRYDWLRCGEVLSAILLSCTELGLATCTLTHMTELPQSRDVIRDTTPADGVPQVVIRVGLSTSHEQQERTPRRPLSEVLVVKREDVGHM